MDSESEIHLEGLDLVEPVEAFALTEAFNEDCNQDKVNLGFSEYKTDDNESWVLPVVRSVELQMAGDVTLDNDYLPVAGLQDFRLAASRLLLGKESIAIIENRVSSVQTVGSTAALKIGLTFLRYKLRCHTVLISEPSSGNARDIAKSLDFTINEYQYWDSHHRCINIKGMLSDIEGAPDCSVIIFSMGGHDPTGTNPSLEEWKLIANILKEKNVFVFFDCAYQGLSSGDVDADAAAVRLFVKGGFELFAAQSFTNNFGLYDDPVGQLLFVVQNSEDLCKVFSQMSALCRVMWSNPPQHGGRIVATVLNNPALSIEWKENVRAMSSRLRSMRQLLYFRLKAIGAPGNWDHVVRQNGFFCYTGLDPSQVEFLKNEYHIYLTRNGRINISGITTSNVDYVVNAIKDAVTNVRSTIPPSSF